MAKYFEETDAGAAVLNRLNKYQATNMSYHDYELYGKEVLLDELNSLGHAEATIDVVYDEEPDDMQDKLMVSGHKIWVFTPILPAVIIRLNE